MHTSATQVRALAALAALLSSPAVLRAQSAQRLSVQVSGLYNSLMGDAYDYVKSGAGVEGQLRYSARKAIPVGSATAAFSFGGGFQWTRHGIEQSSTGGESTVTLRGPFVEPRLAFVLPTTEAFFPYVSMRLSLLQEHAELGNGLDASSSGVTVNGGGGVLFRMGRRVNLDVGATYGFTNFGDMTLVDRSSSQQLSLENGSGSNVILRVGLAIGLR